MIKKNSRLALALHALGHMVREPDRKFVSTQIAEHIGTNPVVVRRVLGKLRNAGIVASERGHSGGWQLTRSAKQISLADIYHALHDEPGLMDNDQEHLCAVEKTMHAKMTGIMQAHERRLIEELALISIAELSAPDVIGTARMEKKQA